MKIEITRVILIGGGGCIAFQTQTIKGNVHVDVGPLSIWTNLNTGYILSLSLSHTHTLSLCVCVYCMLFARGTLLTAHLNQCLVALARHSIVDTRYTQTVI